jgi:hypothetical protein
MSATSTDTDSSSVASRPEKRPSTPSDSPQPKKHRYEDQQNWDVDSPPPGQNVDDNKLMSADALDQSSPKVQLPSINSLHDSRSEIRRASLPTLNHSVRHAPYPSPRQQHYTPSATSSLSHYQFPAPSDDLVEKNRPRVSTDVGAYGVGNYTESPYTGLSSGTTPSSSNLSSTFGSPSDYQQAGLSPYSGSTNGEHWNQGAGIIRPNSTPGQLSSPPVKYDESLRHASFSAMSQAQMFAGSGRISGHHDRRMAGIKGDWSYPNQEYGLPPPHHHSPYGSPHMPSPSSMLGPSPTNSPQVLPPASLVDRPPQRKRGKLPKETTDFLKAWLHRHSDHPYPSEEEKKALCHATGLSMSQVSNWMINVSGHLFSSHLATDAVLFPSVFPQARRRILAPARPSTNPTTTSPYPIPPGRSLPSLLDRRASLPNPEALQLYHPMSLQSLPGHDYMSSRHMGLPPSRSMPLHGPGMDYSSPRNSSMSHYGPGGSAPPPPLPSQYSSVPMSAPPTMSGTYSSPTSYGAGGAGGDYPRQSSGDHYFESTSTSSPTAGGSAPGSGYATPQ